MKTHKVRPILVESKDRHSQLEIDDIFIGKLSYEAKQYHCKHPQELILISLENEKIEKGDKFVHYWFNENSTNKDRIVISTADENTNDKKHRKSFIGKVIARQSQIPLEYISKFIEQYNNGCVEDFEIKCGGSYEEFLDFCGKLGYDYDRAFGWYKRTDPGGNRPNTSKLEDLFNKYPKLTNGFVTIVEKEPISYTEGEVLNLLHKLEFDKNINLAAWFEQNKKK